MSFVETCKNFERKDVNIFHLLRELSLTIHKKKDDETLLSKKPRKLPQTMQVGFKVLQVDFICFLVNSPTSVHLVF